MSEFDKREESFERKFAHDEELRFKILARANRMLALWAAEKLGKTGAEAEAYAMALVEQDVASHAGAGVQGRIHKDFSAAGVPQSEHQIARHFEEFRAVAEKEVKRS
jgi:hypothetical protein